MNKAANQALELLNVIRKRRDAYSRAMRPLMELCPDFPILELPAMDSEIEKGVFALIELVLGDDIGEYWLNEACSMENGGAVYVDRNRKLYRIKTPGDVRQYVRKHLGVDV